MRPAGVGGNVAADGGRALAGRVGGEMVAGGGERPGKLEVDDSRLDHRHAVAKMHAKNAVHPRQGEDDSAATGRAAAGQAGASPAGDDRRAVPAADGQRGDHVVRGSWKNQRVRGLPHDRQAIAVVDRQFRRGRKDVLGPQAAAEFANQGRVGHWSKYSLFCPRAPTFGPAAPTVHERGIDSFGRHAHARLGHMSRRQRSNMPTASVGMAPAAVTFGPAAQASPRRCKPCRRADPRRLCDNPA